MRNMSDSPLRMAFADQRLVRLLRRLRDRNIGIAYG